MLSKCANPVCSAQFLYLHDGKVFRVERDAGLTKPQVLQTAGPSPEQNVYIAAHPAGRPEYFWLCSACAEHLTIGTDRSGVVLVPNTRPVATRAATASRPAA
jgi:hypothetical protein